MTSFLFGWMCSNRDLQLIIRSVILKKGNSIMRILLLVIVVFLGVMRCIAKDNTLDIQELEHSLCEIETNPDKIDSQISICYKLGTAYFEMLSEGGKSNNYIRGKSINYMRRCLELLNSKGTDSIYEKHLEAYINCNLTLGLLVTDSEEAMGYIHTLINYYESTEWEEYSNSQKVLSSLYGLLGKRLESLKKYNSAIEIYKKQLSIRECYSSNQVECCVVLYNIAECYCKASQPDRALDYYEKCVSMRGDKDYYGLPSKSIIMKNTAIAYMAVGKFHEAIAHQLHIIESMERKIQDDAADSRECQLLLASIYDDCGSAYNGLGDYSNSLKNNMKSYLIRLDILGINDNLISESCNNLGTVYTSLGEAEKAEEFFLKSLNNPNIKDKGITLSNLGVLYCDKHDYEKAMSYYLMAIETLSSSYDDNLISIAGIYDNIGVLYMCQGDFDNAIVWSLKGANLFNGTGYIRNTCIAYSNLAAAYFHLEKYDKAISWLNKAIESSKLSGNNNSVYTLPRLYGLASKIYYSINDLDKGRYYQELKIKVENWQIDDSMNRMWTKLLSHKDQNITEEYFNDLFNNFLFCKNDKIRSNMYLIKTVLECCPQFLSGFSDVFTKTCQKLKERDYVKYLVFMTEYFDSGITTYRNEALALFEEEASMASHVTPVYEYILSRAYSRNDEDYADEIYHLNNAITASIDEENVELLFFCGEKLILSLMTHDEFDRAKHFISFFKDFSRDAIETFSLDSSSFISFDILEQLVVALENKLDGSTFEDVINRIQIQAPSICSALFSDFILKSNLYENNKSLALILGMFISSDDICKFSFSERYYISRLYINIGNLKEAYRWFGIDENYGDIADIINSYLKLNDVSHIDSLKIIDRILSYHPHSFVLDGIVYTINDYQIIRLLTLFKYAIIFNRLDVIEQIIQEINPIISSCIHSNDNSMLSELVYLYADYLQQNRHYKDAHALWQRFLCFTNIPSTQEMVAKVKMAQCLIEQGYMGDAKMILTDCFGRIECINNEEIFIMAVCNLTCLNIRNSFEESNNFKRNQLLANAMELLSFAQKHYHCSDFLVLHEIISILQLQNDSTKSRKDKRDTFLSSKLITTHILSESNYQADYWYTRYQFLDKYSLSIDEVEQISYLEKYFENNGSLSTSSPYLCLIWMPEEVSIRYKFLALLAKFGDINRLDYWNKFFETKSTRESFLFGHYSNTQEAFIIRSIYDLVIQSEEAEQILMTESSKPEDIRDKSRLNRALLIKRRLAQYFDDAQNFFSTETKNRLNSILLDRFIISPDSLGQISTILPDDTVCLQYIIVDGKIIIYFSAKDSSYITMVNLSEHNVTSSGLCKLIIQYRSLLQNRYNTSQVKVLSKRIYDLLFPEDLNNSLMQLGIKKIIVNCSEQLRYIPLCTLFDGNSYLIENYQITNVTAMDLLRLAKTVEIKKLDRLNSVVFADPDGSLPLGSIEGEKIASVLGCTKLYLGEEASIKEFESLIGDINIVHLATHAVLDPNSPLNSYILFANNQHWYYNDMVGFNIKNVDLITLSACSTAISEKSTGGEIEGMAYQLLRKSPAGSILASYWPVDDESTAELMIIFYSHIVDSIISNGTLDRGGALREAQLKLLSNPSTSSPYYWAAFTLFGDFR